MDHIIIFPCGHKRRQSFQAKIIILSILFVFLFHVFHLWLWIVKGTYSSMAQGLSTVCMIISNDQISRNNFGLVKKKKRGMVMTILPKETREKFIRQNWLRPSVVYCLLLGIHSLRFFFFPFLMRPTSISLGCEIISRNRKNILSCNNLWDAQHTTTVYSPELKGGVVKMLASRRAGKKKHCFFKAVHEPEIFKMIFLFF